MEARNLPFEIIVVGAAPDAAPLQDELRQRLELVKAGEYVNGHHPNSTTLEGVLNHQPEAIDNLLEEYGWVAALGAHTYAKRAPEYGSETLRSLANKALITAAVTYEDTDEPNFVRHAAREVCNTIAEVSGIKDVDNVYEDPAVRDLFTPYANNETPVNTKIIPVAPRIVPGLRRPEDLPINANAYCAVSKNSRGDLKIVKGKIHTSRHYKENPVLPRTEKDSPGMVRVSFKEPPCAYIADTTSCSVVPVNLANELVNNDEFQAQWFNEGWPIWSSTRTQEEFMVTLARYVAAERQSRAKAGYSMVS